MFLTNEGFRSKIKNVSTYMVLAMQVRVFEKYICNNPVCIPCADFEESMADGEQGAGRSVH